MNVIIYCKGSVIPTNSTNMDIGILSREQNKQNSINKQNRRRQIKKMDSSQTHKIRNLQFQKI